ncbi:MAG: S9 family peptidase, partial [Proteobacteria bacterium]|nr:S9 family peptidase [Pseudomonadota bacterium]
MTNAPSQRPLPPCAVKKPVTTTRHGVTLTDDYAWLRADNWQEVMREPSVLDPAIRSHLEAENAYTEATLAETKPLQEALFAEMKGRIKEDDSSVPSPDGPYEYQTGYVTGGQYPRLLRRPRGGAEGSETLLLDGNKEADGKAYWSLGGGAHSHDHKLLAYAVDDKGSELYTIRVRDLGSGQDLVDAIPDTRGGMVWARDGKTFFYVRLDDNHRPLYVYRHVVGTPHEADVLVYEEKDPGFYVGLGATQSGRYLQVVAHDHQTSEVYLIDAERPADPMRLVSARRHGHEYDVEHAGDTLYIMTNSGGAEDFRIVTAPVATPGEEHWKELV